MKVIRSLRPMTPEDVAREKRSYTGHFLKDVLKRGKRQAAE